VAQDGQVYDRERRERDGQRRDPDRGVAQDCGRTDPPDRGDDPWERDDADDAADEHREPSDVVGREEEEAHEDAGRCDDDPGARGAAGAPIPPVGVAEHREHREERDCRELPVADGNVVRLRYREQDAAEQRERTRDAERAAEPDDHPHEAHGLEGHQRRLEREIAVETDQACERVRRRVEQERVAVAEHVAHRKEERRRREGGTPREHRQPVLQDHDLQARIAGSAADGVAAGQEERPEGESDADGAAAGASAGNHAADRWRATAGGAVIAEGTACRAVHPARLAHAP
jgi:hypothetical protein